MFSGKEFDNYLEEFITFSLKEDIREGDHTSLSTIPEDSPGKATLYVKDKGILAGIFLAENIFSKVDKRLKIETFLKDGQEVVYGDKAFVVEGPVRGILTGERLVLNCLQHLSGVATKTSQMVSLVEGSNVKLLDTRKTTPGLRLLEKYAVMTGGGTNHRIGLFDMILIKDNHIDHAGGVANAIQRVKDYLIENSLDLEIEIETRTLKEIREVMEIGGIQRILIDNFSPDELRKAVKLINKQFFTEASGGITPENLKDYAGTGVDFISTSELTRNFKPLDMSLKIT